VTLYGAQERPAVSWLVLNRSGNTRLTAGSREISARTRSSAISGHQADDIGVHAIAPSAT
jgi:hypothetical protein